MIKKNPWSRWRALNPEPRLWAGQVLSRDLLAGTCSIQIPGGSILTVTGTGVAVGAWAFVQDGKLLGEAPQLDLIQIDL